MGNTSAMVGSQGDIGANASHVSAGNGREVQFDDHIRITVDAELKFRLGGLPGRKGGIKKEAILNAEKAIDRIAGGYLEVARAHVASLIGHSTQLKMASQERSDSVRECIMTVAMDAREIKGEAKTCGYNLLTLVADSLYSFLADRTVLSPRQFSFVNAHIGVMQNIVAFDLKGDGGPTGRELLSSLAIAKKKLDTKEA